MFCGSLLPVSAGYGGGSGRRGDGLGGGGGDGRGSLLHELARGCGRLRCRLELVDASVGRDEALAQLLVLLVQAAELDHDLVEEVIDLVLVIALAELRRLEPLVDDVFWSQCHCHYLTCLL